VSFAYSPENLRLGKAIDVFSNPDRVVMGVRDEDTRQKIQTVLAPITDRIEWMSVESAEMTKHALNAFLATSVVFINEIARICERVGADAKEVERGLKSESRIGAKAYLGPGGAFAGGTLARDIAFLQTIGEKIGVDVPLFQAVETSNQAHKAWAYQRLSHVLGVLSDKTIGIMGLTYKPNTDTLRRSSAVELCKQLAQSGAQVIAYDPKVRNLPDELASIITLAPNAEAPFSGADAVVIATEWADFKALDALTVINTMRQPIILDANRFLRDTFGILPAVRYYTVGKS
jgi:UDPglucose 6-dehydrogenase